MFMFFVVSPRCGPTLPSPPSLLFLGLAVLEKGSFFFPFDFPALGFVKWGPSFPEFSSSFFPWAFFFDHFLGPLVPFFFFVLPDQGRSWKMSFFLRTVNFFQYMIPSLKIGPFFFSRPDFFWQAGFNAPIIKFLPSQLSQRSFFEGLREVFFSVKRTSPVFLEDLFLFPLFTKQNQGFFTESVVPARRTYLPSSSRKGFPLPKDFFAIRPSGAVPIPDASLFDEWFSRGPIGTRALPPLAAALPFSLADSWAPFLPLGQSPDFLGGT